MGAPVTSADEVNPMASLEKSIVFLQTDWSGFIQVPPDVDAAGEGYWTDKLTYSVTCTGFYVSKTAQIVTAGHCVDPAEGRKVIIDGYLQEQQAMDMADVAYANWPVEGEADNSPVERSVRGVQPNGVDGATITSPTTVEVVDFKGPNAGDVALLHLPNVTKETPAMVIARDAPQIGAEVTSIGFPGDIQDISDQSQIARASFKAGTVSSQQVTPSGVVQIEVSSTLAGGMSGGPTVNQEGQVIGVNSSGLIEAPNFNFVTNTRDLRSFLLSNNVALAEPPAPSQGFGLGMLWYVLGAAVLALAVAVVVVVVIVLQRRNARRAPTVPYYPTPAQMPAPPGTAPFAQTPGLGVGQSSGGATVLSPPGPTVEARFCPHCGAPHQHADPFCPACGRPVT
ncbi:hypothetical protein CRI77_26490 [Mycolicibacterium duvalii]|nr:hypothetical protein CRI77_26490 [Mycolicibacterium duvalii]